MACPVAVQGIAPSEPGSDSEEPLQPPPGFSPPPNRSTSTIGDEPMGVELMPLSQHQSGVVDDAASSIAYREVDDPALM